VKDFLQDGFTSCHQPTASKYWTHRTVLLKKNTHKLRRIRSDAEDKTHHDGVKQHGRDWITVHVTWRKPVNQLRQQRLEQLPRHLQYIIDNTLVLTAVQGNSDVLLTCLLEPLCSQWSIGHTDQMSPSSSVLRSSFHLSPVHPVVLYFIVGFCLHEFFGLPLLRYPSGFQYRDCFGTIYMSPLFAVYGPTIATYVFY